MLNNIVSLESNRTLLKSTKKGYGTQKKPEQHRSLFIGRCESIRESRCTISRKSRTKSLRHTMPVTQARHLRTLGTTEHHPTCEKRVWFYITKRQDVVLQNVTCATPAGILSSSEVSSKDELLHQARSEDSGGASSSSSSVSEDEKGVMQTRFETRNGIIKMTKNNEEKRGSKLWWIIFENI